MRDGDHVDHLMKQWQQVWPELDVSPMGVIARISRLCRMLERRVEEVYAKHGLNRAQFGVLAALRRAGPPFRLSPTELYNSLLITSGAMTNRLERLTTAGYVRRVPDPRDGRSLLVALTPKGRRLIDRVLTIHYDTERRLLAPLPAAERETLARIMRRLLIAYETDGGPEAAAPGDAVTARSSRRPRAGSDRSRRRPPGTRET